MKLFGELSESAMHCFQNFIFTESQKSGGNELLFLSEKVALSRATYSSFLKKIITCQSMHFDHL